MLPPGLELDTFAGFGFVAVALVEARSLRLSGVPKACGQDFFLAGYRSFTRFRLPDGRTIRPAFYAVTRIDGRWSSGATADALQLSPVRGVDRRERRSAPGLGAHAGQRRRCRRDGRSDGQPAAASGRHFHRFATRDGSPAPCLSPSTTRQRRTRSSPSAPHARTGARRRSRSTSSECRSSIDPSSRGARRCSRPRFMKVIDHRWERGVRHALPSLEAGALHEGRAGVGMMRRAADRMVQLALLCGRRRQRRHRDRGDPPGSRLQTSGQISTPPQRLRFCG